MDTLLADLCFPEGPRWRDGRLVFSDMHAHEVVAVGLDGQRETICRVEGKPSGLGWLPDGRMIVVSMHDHRLLVLGDDGELAEWASLDALGPFICNDAIVDAKGRIYVGNFGFDMHGGGSPKTTTLLFVDEEGRARIAADDMSFPNGMVITPDGSTLVVGESFGARLTAFDIASDGGLSRRRVWAQMEGAVPDGICLDAEGAIWVASPISAEVLRIREGGEVTDRIPTEQGAFACMLGGPEGRHLLVCTADDSDPAVCEKQRSGRIKVLQVEVPHAGLP